MKQIGIIKEVIPFSENSYTDEHGQTQLFASLGIIVTLGTSSAYIEFIQDQARRAAKVLAEGQTIAVMFDMKAESYPDKNGVVRHKTILRGRDYQVFSACAY